MDTLSTLAGALVEPLALLISGAAVILLRQWLGVRIRESDQAQLADLVQRALAYGVDKVAQGPALPGEVVSGATLPPARRNLAVSWAVGYARERSPELLKRIGASDDALAGRIIAEIATKG